MPSKSTKRQRLPVALSFKVLNIVPVSSSKEHVGFRLPSELVARLDVIATELSKRAAGVDVNRSTVARRALETGVEAMEKEIGIVSPLKGSKSKR